MTATSANRRLAASAKQDTAEVLVRPFPAMRCRADGFCGTSTTRHVGRWQLRVLGRRATAAAMSRAAAGARVRAGAVLRCAREQDGLRVSSLKMLGACPHAHERWKRALASTA